MFFWFKSKPLVMDCFTYNALVFDRYKPEQAVNVFPDWFKKLDHKEANIKHCLGFKEFFKNSVSLNMWTTLNLTVDTKNRSYTWETGLENQNIGNHSPEQYGYFLRTSEYQHLKLINPWKLKTNRYVKFSYVDSFWCRNTHDYFFPNAVLDYYYQHDNDVNMFISYKNPKDVYQITIEAGQPLVFLIPLSTEKIELRHHLVTEQEYLRYCAQDVMGLKRYSIRKKHTNKLLSQQKKCPFGFGKK